MSLLPFRSGRKRGFVFAAEISLAVALKVVVLWLLWHAFFSAPQTKKMRLPTNQVEQHLLMPARLQGPISHPTPIISTETQHDFR